MKDIPVLLKDRKQIEKFVQINKKLDCQVDVSDGHVYINGKSIIGLLALSLFDPIHVYLIGDDKNISRILDAYKANDLIA